MAFSCPKNRFLAVGLSFIFASITLACSSLPVGKPTSGAFADSAMVVTRHPLATKAGVDIMRMGGNAVDAAVAVQMALAVVLPEAGNIGGGGFMIARVPEGAVYALDFREKAPIKGNKDMYLDENGEVIPRLSLDGALAAGVPGSVAGLWAAHDSLGKLPWATVMQPAIDLAQNGFPLSRNQARLLNNFQERFNKLNTEPTRYQSAEPWEVGDTLRLPELAATLTRIRDLGPDGFYAGETADLIVSYMEKSGGMISHNDLEAYQPVWREPLQGSYKDLQITTMGAPSAGGLIMLQTLGMLAGKTWPGTDISYPVAAHQLVEAERRAYADRAEYVGDPDLVEVPTKALLRPDYLKARFRNFNPQNATPSDSVRAGKVIFIEKNETTHFSIIDPDGMAVAITTTLNGNYGAGVVVPGAGFFLNNEMDDFSISPGVPNQFGLTGGAANAIEPQKRMVSSMTPTIVTRKGKLWLVIGAPGGSTIPSSVMQTLLRMYEYGVPAQEAVAARRFYCQWLPDELAYESDAFTAEQLKQLQGMGHHPALKSGISLVNAIEVRADGKLGGGADPRSDAQAAGY